MIILRLTARDFASATYMRHDTCPVANAANRQFVARDAMEFMFCVFVNGKKFTHEAYTEYHFLKDLSIAQSRKFDTTIIRELELIESHD
jgi:hypothetical protein